MIVLVVAAPSIQAGDATVSDIRAVHRHGQTFVTWEDLAEGEAGAKYRYSLYRSERPITADNLDKAELCYQGVVNCSGKLFGHAFNMKDRLDPAKPYAILSEGGKPLPPWSGLAVHTVRKAGKAYYAVIATDEKLKPASVVTPGKSATTEAAEERPGPIQPIKLFDSKERKSYVAQTSITGTKGLGLHVSVHGSQAQGGPAGEWGDYYLYFGTPDMGYRDGLPGVFTVHEMRAKEGNRLVLWPRDAIEHSSGRGAFETMWLGYYCIPHGAAHQEPRYYRFTENRLLWMVDWSLKRYGADPQRVSMGGSSMGGLGSINVGFRHPELFAAVYPSTAPFLWWPPSSLVGLQKRDAKTLLADGKTLYVDYTNSPKFAAEHHEDMPFLGWAVGRKDPNHQWQEYVDMVKALTTNHHGFCFAWNDGGHSEGGRPMNTIQKLPRFEIRPQPQLSRLRQQFHRQQAGQRQQGRRRPRRRHQPRLRLEGRERRGSPLVGNDLERPGQGYDDRGRDAAPLSEVQAEAGERVQVDDVNRRKWHRSRGPMGAGHDAQGAPQIRQGNGVDRPGGTETVSFTGTSTTKGSHASLRYERYRHRVSGRASRSGWARR